MTVAELWFGAVRRNSKKLRGLVSTFTASIEVLPFDAIAATEYGKVAAALDKKGSPIGHFDALIVAHARSRGLTVVTANSKRFTQVAKLRVENWF